MCLEILHKPRKRQDQNDKAHDFMACRARVIRTLPGIIPICFYANFTFPPTFDIEPLKFGSPLTNSDYKKKATTSRYPFYGLSEKI